MTRLGQPRTELARRARGPDKEGGKRSVEVVINSVTLAGQRPCRDPAAVRTWEQATPCRAAGWATQEAVRPWVGWVRQWAERVVRWAPVPGPREAEWQVVIRATAEECPWAADTAVA
jgi:hypothetical protein